MSVLAVPRSIARSVEKYLETKENILIRQEISMRPGAACCRCNIIAQKSRRIKALAALSHAFPRTGFPHRAAGAARAGARRGRAHAGRAERDPRGRGPPGAGRYVGRRADGPSPGSVAAPARG